MFQLLIKCYHICPYLSRNTAILFLGNSQKKLPNLAAFFFGDPWGNRTPVSAVRGRCLSRLTNGPCIGKKQYIINLDKLQ